MSSVSSSPMVLQARTMQFSTWIDHNGSYLKSA